MRFTFDRGTLLMRPSPPSAVLAVLPNVLWDPRVEAHRAPAFEYKRLCSALATSIRDGVEDRVADWLPAPKGFAPLELRPYQEAAIGAWAIAGCRGVVVLPTGGGKTRVAIAAVARSDRPSLILVPTRALLEQWLTALRAAYPGPIGVYGDGVRDLASVTVSTFESAYRHMPQLGNRFDLLVIDEAHHFGGGSRDEALEMCIARARLGLTATPREDTENRVRDLVGPVVFERTLRDLAGRFLADFDLFTFHLDLTQDERAQYERLRSVYVEAFANFRRIHPGADWYDFSRVASSSGRGWQALEAWQRARKLAAFTEAKKQTLSILLAKHRDARVLVFTASNDTAYQVAREHLIMPITCEIGREERARSLALFRSGELRALVSSRVLNEGLDVPDADVGIIVGGAQGAREHVQRVGRLLRPKEGKRATVYDLVSRATSEVARSKRRNAALGPRASASR